MQMPSSSSLSATFQSPNSLLQKRWNFGRSGSCFAYAGRRLNSTSKRVYFPTKASLAPAAADPCLPRTPIQRARGGSLQDDDARLAAPSSPFFLFRLCPPRPGPPSSTSSSPKPCSLRDARLALALRPALPLFRFQLGPSPKSSKSSSKSESELLSAARQACHRRLRSKWPPRGISSSRCQASAHCCQDVFRAPEPCLACPRPLLKSSSQSAPKSSKSSPSACLDWLAHQASRPAP
mmetsp:Transcript_116791/g.330428  ORF Transcript_116791/g.330428 Transcript_116791/m.330428 type:complete len:236 (-) Transcript_116791:282-989(-)